MASRVPVYRGPFRKREAERLLWRAGFGPKPGQAAAVAKKGLKRAVDDLLNPPKARLVGPAPVADDGGPLAPRDAWGHDHLWWLDRMVRSNRQLHERMTLVWHDWFATSNSGVGSQKLMLDQNAFFRANALGNFESLLLGVTKNPAMLIWLNGVQNTKWSPNENYARELMELFTLGAGRGYTEEDVREQARALTGWRVDWRDGVGYVNFRYDAGRHDTGTKVIFGKSGNFGWQDACRLCVRNPLHASFFVRKLWSYFIPVPPPAGTRSALIGLYKRSGYKVKPVVGAILRHPLLYTGPRMMKPPVVQVAGMHRARGRRVNSEAWSWISSLDGQRLFYPPNVAGWDDARWLDTSSLRGRWIGANHLASPYALDVDAWRGRLPLDAGNLVDRAAAFWGSPTTTTATRTALRGFAETALADADSSWKRAEYPVLVVNALRVLFAISPDYQTC
ncbi:MAG TPA: DUF1800 domain-containing protein [Gaiellaceae bacterium]|nr:DUF1800 domain-containing protein [Gaiellaceae bacterium]